MAERITPVDPRVAHELEALALDGASGVMEVHGSPGGAIYLDGGRVTFAESPAAPGLGVRLTGSRLLPDADWSELPDPDDPHGSLGAILTTRGLIARDELGAVLRSAALDAIMALTVPAVGGSVVEWTRFTPRAWHWAGSIMSIDLPSVRAEVVRRGEDLTRYGIPAGACPKLSDMGGPWAVISPEQWALASRIDGLSTIRDLAWRNGLGLHDAMERVAELAQQGLCVVSLPAKEDSAGETAIPSAHLPPAAAEVLPANESQLATTPAGLPRRRRAVSWVPAARRAGGPDRPAGAEALPDPIQPDLLHQLLDGLRRMRLRAQVTDRRKHAAAGSWPGIRPGIRSAALVAGSVTSSSRSATSCDTSRVVAKTLRPSSAASPRGVDSLPTRISSDHCRADIRIRDGRFELRRTPESAVSRVGSCSMIARRRATSEASISTRRSSARSMPGSTEE